MKEIEIKLLFKDKRKIISNLGLNIIPSKKEKLFDRYYSQRGLNMSNANDLVRIREIKNGYKRIELTYKSKAKNKKNIWYRTETTLEIISSREMGKFLEKIGFKKISEYKSEKEYWFTHNCSITFAKFIKPTFLEFMEIEGKSEKNIKNLIGKIENETEKAGEEIFKIFDQKSKNKFKILASK